MTENESRSLVKVNADDLKTRADWIRDRLGDWPTQAPKAGAPDSLQSTLIAIENLNAFGESLQEHVDVTKDEGMRLAMTLTDVATAYDLADGHGKDLIEKTAKAEAVPVPPPHPEPSLPPGPPRPQMVSTDGYANVLQTQELLHDPGELSSLRQAGDEAFKTALTIQRDAPPVDVHGWIGDAAKAAAAKFNSFREWIDKLAEAWAQYVVAGQAIADAHTAAVAEHHPIWERYTGAQEHLDKLLQQSSPNHVAIEQTLKAMEAEERNSAELRVTYANKADVELGSLPEPPFGVRPFSGGRPGAEGTGGGGPAGGQPSGTPTDEPSVSPASMNSGARQPQAGSPVGAGAPSGGGSPVGGSAPAGGAPTGGLPGGLPGDISGDMPQLTGPSLEPASAGGGGTGAGGGGGGLGASPLGPAVTAETVAPGPAAARSGAAPIAGGAAGGGMMMGGMGGMPMGGMGGQGQNQNKEKRRDPKLAGDEDLYTEDRPWTEGVIGNRRRTDTKAPKGPRETGSSDG